MNHSKTIILSVFIFISIIIKAQSENTDGLVWYTDVMKANEVSKTTTLLPQKEIENRIFTLRNLQVMIDRDLAEMYGVETKVLN